MATVLFFYSIFFTFGMLTYSTPDNKLDRSTIFWYFVFCLFISLLIGAFLNSVPPYEITIKGIQETG